MLKGRLRKHGFAVACVVAGASGVAIASVIPASAASGITVQAWAAPAGSNATLPFVNSIVQGLNGQEWFITYSGSQYGIGEATTGGTVTELTPTLTGGNQAYTAMINGPDEFVWLVNNVDPTDHLSAINSSGVQTVVDSAGTKNDLDITELDGKLWVSDNSGTIDQYNVTSMPGATLANQYPTGGFSPDAIASTTSSDWIWFSDDFGHLHYMTTTGNPFAVAGSSVSHATHTMVQGPDGNLWAISDATNGYGNTVEQINAATGSVMHTYSSGIPAGAQLTSITVGADGNLYFPEAGANDIGQLNPSTGTITNLPLPSGFLLPTSAVYDTGFDIAPGPNDTVWFNAQTSGGQAAVGEVSGLSTTTTTTGTTTGTTTTSTPPPPALGRVSILGTAKVSSKGIASVTLICNGHSGTACSGQLTLTVKVKSKVKRGNKTVTVTKTKTLGPVRYAFDVGKSATEHVKLTRAVLTALDATKSHRLTATATAKPVSGSPTRRSVTLVGPRPKKKG